MFQKSINSHVHLGKSPHKMFGKEKPFHKKGDCTNLVCHIQSRPTRFRHYQLSKSITAQNFISVRGCGGFSAILCSYVLKKCCPVLIKPSVLSPVSPLRKLMGPFLRWISKKSNLTSQQSSCL